MSFHTFASFLCEKAMTSIWSEVKVWYDLFDDWWYDNLVLAIHIYDHLFHLYSSNTRHWSW